MRKRLRKMVGTPKQPLQNRQVQDTKEEFNVISHRMIEYLREFLFDLSEPENREVLYERLAYNRGIKLEKHHSETGEILFELHQLAICVGYVSYDSAIHSLSKKKRMEIHDKFSKSYCTINDFEYFILPLIRGKLGRFIAYSRAPPRNVLIFISNFNSKMQKDEFWSCVYNSEVNITSHLMIVDILEYALYLEGNYNLKHPQEEGWLHLANLTYIIGGFFNIKKAERFITELKGITYPHNRGGQIPNEKDRIYLTSTTTCHQNYTLNLDEIILTDPETGVEYVKYANFSRFLLGRLTNKRPQFFVKLHYNSSETLMLCKSNLEFVIQQNLVQIDNSGSVIDYRINLDQVFKNWTWGNYDNPVDWPVDNGSREKTIFYVVISQIPPEFLSCHHQEFVNYIHYNKDPLGNYTRVDQDGKIVLKRVDKDLLGLFIKFGVASHWDRPVSNTFYKNHRVGILIMNLSQAENMELEAYLKSFNDEYGFTCDISNEYVSIISMMESIGITDVLSLLNSYVKSHLILRSLIYLKSTKKYTEEFLCTNTFLVKDGSLYSMKGSVELLTYLRNTKGPSYIDYVVKNRFKKNKEKSEELLRLEDELSQAKCRNEIARLDAETIQIRKSGNNQ